MQKTLPFLALAALVACAPSSRFVDDLPEEVVELAAPNQNLDAVVLLEEDGCYWYEHVGPVETTLLPLMSRRGRHICMREPS